MEPVQRITYLKIDVTVVIPGNKGLALLSLTHKSRLFISLVSYEIRGMHTVSLFTFIYRAR